MLGPAGEAGGALQDRACGWLLQGEGAGCQTGELVLVGRKAVWFTCNVCMVPRRLAEVSSRLLVKEITQAVGLLPRRLHLLAKHPESLGKLKNGYIVSTKSIGQSST